MIIPQHFSKLVLFVLLSSASVVPAQRYAPNEVTVGLQARTWGQQYVANNQPAYYHYLQIPTVSFSYTRNLSSTLALEGTVEPWSQFFRDNAVQSGHETIALGGIKAGWRGERWGFYGKTEAGITSQSCAQWYTPPPYSHCSRITNFALEYGGVMEYRLSPAFALRVDAGHLESLEFDQVTYRSSNLTISTFGGMLQHFDARVGITRCFGASRDPSSERILTQSGWEIGASFLLQPKTEPMPGDVNVYASPGAWATWNFSPHISWDSALIHSGPGRFGEYDIANYQAGGRSLEALTGLKMGLRRDRMGYFAKLRGGTITFGETERRIGIEPGGQIFVERGMFTNPVLDVGGVWEVYPCHHMLLRFDAGSATVFYQPKGIWQYVPKGSVDVGTKYEIPGFTETGLLLTFGGGFRF